MVEYLSSNSRLAKNTMLLYMRMFLIMGISLYTSRIILHELGVEDFGIYNLVNGIIISFSFFNTALVSASQRFLAFALGKGDEKAYNCIFSSCITLYIIIGFTFCVILTPVGLWLIDEKLIIPTGRLYASKMLFQYSVLTFFVSFVRIPYNSVVISQEKMSFYAYLGFIEAILKLSIVFVLTIIPLDKLVSYGCLNLVVTIIITIAFVVFATKNLKTKFSLVLDKNMFKKLFGFSSWSLYEGMANIGKIEIVSFILNSIYGVVINATIGVAKQVNSAIINFIANFQTAFRPQITKCYAAGDNKRLLHLIFNTSKFSGVIFFIIALPICYNMDFILHLWLGKVPENSASFAVCFILASGLEAIGGPFWIASHAMGNIRKYQFISGTIRVFSIPIVYLYVHTSLDVAYVFTVMLLTDGLVYVYRLLYLYEKMKFPLGSYIRNVLFKLIIVVLVAWIVIMLLCHYIHSDWLQLIVSTVISIVVFIFLSFMYLMNGNQRKNAIEYVRSRFV